jgi:hypothetical protein
MSESSEMRHAQLEWGYPPPRPNFIRRVRTALIATAVGAAAGGIVVFSFVDRSVDKESVTPQGQATQVASTPTLPLIPKRMDSESVKAAEVSGHSESAAASVSSTSSTVPGAESSHLAGERTATYHELARPMADGAKTSAGAVALLETNAPKRHRITTRVKPAADNAGLHRVNTTCALELLPIRAMRTMGGSGRIRMPVGVMTAGINSSESRVGPPVAMRCGGSQPNPVSVDLFDNDNGGHKLMSARHG